MKRILSTALVFAIAFVPAIVPSAVSADEEPIRIYVTAEGTSGDGSEGSPIVGIYAARDKARELKNANTTKDIEVIFKTGNYYLTSSVTFGVNDSAAPDRTITYKAGEGQTPVFTAAAKEIFYEDLSPVPGQAGVYQATLSGTAINNLYENGNAAVKARWPKADRRGNQLPTDTEGYAFYGGAPGYNRATGPDSNPTMKSFIFKTENFPSFTFKSGLEASIWPGGPGGGYSWEHAVRPVQSIGDMGNGEKMVNFADNVSYLVIGKGSRYFLQGAEEFMLNDNGQPGEFYHDGTTLKYIPRSLTSNTVLSIPFNDHIFKIEGSSISNSGLVTGLRFEGLEITGSDRNKSGIFIANARDIIVKDCNIHDIGGDGITITGQTGLTSNYNVYGIGNTQRIINIPDDGNIRLTGNRIANIGNTGVNLYYGSNKYGSWQGGWINWSAWAGGIHVVNNHISNIGQTGRSAAGIAVSDVHSCYIANNLIHDGPRYGIRTGSSSYMHLRWLNRTGTQDWDVNSNDVVPENVDDVMHSYGNIVEYNEMYKLAQDSQDVGAFYSWSARGRENARNEVNYNYVHDLDFPYSYSYGIYLDDSTDYTDVKGNLVTRLNLNNFKFSLCDGPMFIKGLSNRVTNNVFADNAGNSAVVMQEMDGELTQGNIFSRNIAYNIQAGVEQKLPNSGDPASHRNNRMQLYSFKSGTGSGVAGEWRTTCVDPTYCKGPNGTGHWCSWKFAEKWGYPPADELAEANNNLFFDPRVADRASGYVVVTNPDDYWNEKDITNIDNWQNPISGKPGYPVNPTSGKWDSNSIIHSNTSFPSITRQDIFVGAPLPNALGIGNPPISPASAPGDYRLKATSPAYSLGIEDLPLDKMGLTKDFKYAVYNNTEPVSRLFIKPEGQPLKSLAETNGEGGFQLDITARSKSGFALDPLKGTMQFSSSNKNVATVDGNGYVTILSEGKTTITARVVINGGDVRTTLDLNCAPPPAKLETFLVNGNNRETNASLATHARLTLAGGEPAGLMFVVAYYTADGKLTGVEPRTVEAANIDIPLNKPSQADRLKLFLWNWDGMEPYLLETPQPFYYK